MNNDSPGDPDGEQLRRRVEFIAHDLNHLVTLILGYNELLLERNPESGVARHDLEQIQRAASRVASLTRQLQEVRGATPPSIVDLNALIGESEKLMRGVLGQEIVLSTLLDPKLGRIKAVPEQIDRVLVNLALNASAAMPAGGEVIIATANVERDTGSFVQVQFIDNGCGMDLETVSSSGLGLSIVREMVNHAGGSIDIRSAPAQGATITIVFPRIAETAARPDDHRERTILAARGRSPDAAAGSRHARRGRLQSPGSRQRRAGNGNAGAARNRFDAGGYTDAAERRTGDHRIGAENSPRCEDHRDVRSPGRLP